MMSAFKYDGHENDNVSASKASHISAKLSLHETQRAGML